jgi:acyl-CoA thioesterase FadM
LWSSEFELRLSDLDGLGHLTASAYLVLFEESRAAWLMQALDVDYPHYAVARQSIQYHHEVRFADGPLKLDLVVTDIRRSSFDVVEHLHAGGRLCASSEATLVAFDLGERRSRPLTDSERGACEAALARSGE